MYLLLQGSPAAVELINMSKKTSSHMLSNSTGDSRGTSSRVALVLKSLVREDWTQSSLAVAAGINRGVLNQLLQSKTGSTPRLIGRLCALLTKEQAAELLAAFFEDLSEELYRELKTVRRVRVGGPGDCVVKVRFPPPAAE